MVRKRLNSFNLTESQLRGHYESFNTILPKQFIWTDSTQYAEYMHGTTA